MSYRPFDTYTGWWGVEDEHGTVLYADNFDNEAEAQKFADAHNQGARSYSEADAMIYGLDPEGWGKGVSDDEETK